MKKIISFILVLVACFFTLTSCAREQMDSDELTAKRIIEQSDEIGDVEYVNLLEEANNGYHDFYYYDVIAKDGKKYIIEIKDTGSRKVMGGLTREYKSKSDRKEHLQALIEYRCSKFGSLSDDLNY